MINRNLDVGMRKYIHYLDVAHSWGGINCFTLIEDIYNNFLNIDLSDIWKRVGWEDGKTGIDRTWIRKYQYKQLLNEMKYWDKVEITDLQEFDILVFTSKQNNPIHFGLYVGQNTFLHVEEKSFCSFALFDDVHRGRFYGAFRHRSLVQ